MRREGESSHSAAKQPPLDAAVSNNGGYAQIAVFAKSWSAGHIERVNGPKLSFPVW